MMSQPIAATHNSSLQGPQKQQSADTRPSKRSKALKQQRGRHTYRYYIYTILVQKKKKKTELTSTSYLSKVGTPAGAAGSRHSDDVTLDVVFDHAQYVTPRRQ